MGPFSLASLSSSSLSKLLERDPSFRTQFKDARDHHDFLHRFSGELYPKHISQRMIATTFIMGMAGIYALYWECYVLSLTVAVLVIMSLNYWRKPTKGTRRNIDIATVLSVVLCHWIYGLMVFDAETAIQYTVVMAPGAMFFGVSKICAKRGFCHLDSLFHCTMHVYGAIVNVWIYPKMYQNMNSHL